MRQVAAVLAALILAAGCTGDPRPQPAASSLPPSPVNPSSASSAPAGNPSGSRPQARPKPTAAPTPTMNAQAALRDVRRLASAIGPREATSDNFAKAADLVEERFEQLGYRVRRTPVRVPAGNSWGTPVPRGTSANVIADPPRFNSGRPHLVVGAHLDTVPVAPGAEDNASGIAVMLELARMAAQHRPKLPVRFIAFGAEEPRGSGDALHHFGSRQHVATLAGAERRALRAMVSLDRVGVRASYAPVCRGNQSGVELQRALRAEARRLGIATRSCINVASDHWSYAKARIPAVRLGGIPYAGYHSPDDVASVVDPRQLDRVGRLVWAWLHSPN